jgi:hypothetical protein
MAQPKAASGETVIGSYQLSMASMKESINGWHGVANGMACKWQYHGENDS